MRSFKLRNPESRTIESLARALYKLAGYKKDSGAEDCIFSDESNPDYNYAYIILSAKVYSGKTGKSFGREKLIELRYFGNGQKSDRPIELLAVFYDDACSINYSLIQQLQKYFDGDYPARRQDDRNAWSRI